MEFEQYTDFVKKQVECQIGSNILYPVLGIAGEAGEVAEKVKKSLRDRSGRINKTLRRDILLELGDLLFYIEQTALDLNSSMGEVVSLNMKKLKSRKKRGTINGKGDHR